MSAPGSLSEVSSRPSAARPTMELSESTLEARRQHTILLLKMEAQRRARTVDVPSDAEEVKLKLRSLGQPITLFGEGPYDRRERLKLIVAELDVAAAIKRDGLDAVVAAASNAQAAYQPTAVGVSIEKASSVPSSTAPAEQFYTPASAELVAVRNNIAEFSFKKANEQLEAERAAFAERAYEEEDNYATELYISLSAIKPQSSQISESRPLTDIAATTDGKVYSVGSWNNTVKLWCTDTMGHLITLKGHTDRVVGLAWHPGASLLSNGDHNAISVPPILASSSIDGTVRVWKLPKDDISQVMAHYSSSAIPTNESEVPSMDVDDDNMNSKHSSMSELIESLTRMGIATETVLKGHTGRLGSVDFHPSGNYIGSAGFDKTWMLWDVETSKQLLIQEGHSHSVYSIAFHHNGALVATGDLSGAGRVWDLRSGKAIFPLRAHKKQLISLSWCPKSYSLASGSEDQTINIWDIRQQRTLYTIPAHNSLISRVQFSPVSGEYLMSASFDGTLKLWNTRTWTQLVDPMVSHEGRVTGACILGGEKRERTILSAGSDRTVKVWHG